MSEYVGLYMDPESVNTYKMNNKKNFLLDRPLKTEIIEQGVILPSKEDTRSKDKKLWAAGGVINTAGEFVPLSELGTLWGGVYHYDLNDEDRMDEDVLLMGPFIAHWGHFICDEISRLWYYAKHPDKNLKIVYCSWLFGQDISEFNIYGNYLELLNLIGIKDSQLINITKPTRFRKIIIPEISFVPRQYYTEEYLSLIKTVVSNACTANLKTYEKVYFTRQNFFDAQQKEYGEAEIASFFRENGYTVMSPETLTVKEQIHYFQNCKSIAMISGTISHNLIFSSPGIQAIILNKMGVDNDYQIIVDHIADAKITYINVFFRGFPVLFGVGPFWIGLNRYLKNWATSHNIAMKKSTSGKFMGMLWYIKKYKQTYIDNKQMRYWLKHQQRSLKMLKQSMKSNSKS